MGQEDASEVRDETIVDNQPQLSDEPTENQTDIPPNSEETEKHEPVSVAPQEVTQTATPKKLASRSGSKNSIARAIVEASPLSKPQSKKNSRAGSKSNLISSPSKKNSLRDLANDVKSSSKPGKYSILFFLIILKNNTI
jgi:hypothetical protein